ncbi:MAG TPA: bile acid:sodium symporter [Syntrophales bacterium]|nr:bile acid:sodium symporter [Syntrophales bacterium]
MALPFRSRDIVLLAVVFSSMAAGICCPAVFAFLQPYPLLCLMILFFMSFLSIRLEAVREALHRASLPILSIVVLKMFLLPVALYFVFLYVLPDYAVAALLLTGVSTGVVAPFMSNLVGGNSARVLVVTIITSILVPFSLPAVVGIVLAKSVHLSFWDMLQVLALAIFVPIAAVQVLRRWAPRWLDAANRRSYPVNLVMFALINLGVFSKFAGIFYTDPTLIVEAAIVDIVLSVVYCVVGILFFLGRPIEDRVGGAVMLAHMNNILLVVFCSHFFGPRETMVAAMYLLPFFGLVLPLRYYRGRIEGN